MLIAPDAQIVEQYSADAGSMAIAHAFGQHEMMAVAGRKIVAGLGDADDRLAGAQLLRRQSEVHVALEIERRHAGIFRIVEPELRAEVLAARMRRWRSCAGCGRYSTCRFRHA